jgi:hypothetical protein
VKAIGIVLAMVGYTVGSWGYVLVKGYNITLVQWVSPLHPFSGAWPPQCVPPGFIFPTSSQPGVPCKGKGAASTTGSNDPAVKRADKAAKTAHRTTPGSVAGRL